MSVYSDNWCARVFVVYTGKTRIELTTFIYAAQPGSNNSFSNCQQISALFVHIERAQDITFNWKTPFFSLSLCWMFICSLEIVPVPVQLSVRPHHSGPSRSQRRPSVAPTAVLSRRSRTESPDCRAYLTCSVSKLPTLADEAISYENRRRMESWKFNTN